MTIFVLTLNLEDHEHPGNQRAQHATVCQMLQAAMQAIGGDMNRKGTLAMPGNVHIGTWEFQSTPTRAHTAAQIRHIHNKADDEDRQLLSSTPAA
jgi:hypothetical protein